MSAKQIEPKVITADGILKAIEKGAKSLTGVAKLLGYKSGSSATLKKITQMVPDIEARLAINTPAKDSPKVVANEAKPKAVKAGKKTAKVVPADKKPSEKKTAGKSEYVIPDCCPYRHAAGNPSGYSLVFSILFAFKDTGISKKDLVAKYMAWSGKPEKNANFDTHVVASPRQDGTAHRSASKAADVYWVERENDFYRLHLVSESKK